MALTIERVLAWEALDSRGTPTVACVVTLAGGAEGEAIVPSGASVGTHEAHELRDGADRFAGKGTQSAVAHVNDEIAEALRGADAGDQDEVAVPGQKGADVARGYSVSKVLDAFL